MERRSFLRLLGSGGAAASALPTPVRGAVHAEPSRTPLEIGQERQLFLDDHVVETMEPRVFRLLNQPVRYRDNPVIPLGTDWQQKGGLSHGGDAGAVLYDPERKLYRFYGWMIPWPPLGSSVRKFIFYAESEDGLHWRKPPLGQVRYLGYDTNFIRLPFLGDASPGNLGVFRDPAARRPQERYKIVFQGKQDGAGGLYPGYSADGIRFHRYPVSRPIIPFYSDTNNNAIWNPGTNEYLVYHRTYPRLDRWFQPEPVYPEGARVRTAAWAASRDFLDWDGPSDKQEPEERYFCFHADAADRIGDRDFYTLEVLPYGGGLVGFTSVYHNLMGQIPAGTDLGKARSPWVDRIDVQLLWSRDARRFERVGDRRVFLPNGPEGSWDEHLCYTVQAPIVREDLGEIWIYYEGFGGRHVFNQRGEQQRGQIGLAILRLDGFVSITGAGSLTTRPLVFEGNRLRINATGRDRYAGDGYGTVKVALLDGETSQALPGYGLDDCRVFGGDSISHTVSWRGSADVGALEGKPVRVRFQVHRAKLFSFQFAREPV